MKELLFLLVLFVSNVIQAITGFAGTVLAMPPSVYLLGLDHAKVVLNVMAWLSGLIIAVTGYRHINWKELLKMSAVMLVGMFAGIQICRIVKSENILLTIYGIIIVVVALKNLCIHTEKKLPDLILWIVLILAGIIHGMFVSGGALLVIYATQVLKEKEEFRATVAPVWVVLNFFLMVTQFRSGLVGTADIRLICISILPLLIATWLGKKLVCKVSQKVFLNLTIWSIFDRLMQLITGSCGGERCINMAVTLREIIKQVQHLEMKLVAGEAGLDHEVSWTHMVDSDTISAFLQGQELTFTTGLGLNENLTLLRLVKEVWRNKASGIVINTGPYISEIGQDVIDFANEKGFPVFEVPWRVRMAEIMRIICFAITKEQQNAIEVATALNNAFLCPSQEELYVSALMRKGYFTDSAYTVVNVCVLEDNDRVTGTRLEQILSKLSSHIRCNYNGILCCAQDKQILLVLCDYSDEACRKTTERIFQILCRMVCQKEQIFVSVSKQISGIRQIYKSYQFAEKMSDLLCVCQVPGEQSTDGGKIIFYKDLGIYRVLLTLTDKEAIKEYLADTVAPLYEYDEMNHSDLVRVLQCYLANDCSVKSASQELIVHRNTINYKLGKAAEILGKNLSDFDVRFQLRLGFLLYQMNEM